MKKLHLYLQPFGQGKLAPQKTRKLTLDQIIERRRKICETARARCGEPVQSLQELGSLAMDRKSVYCDNTWGLLPATVVLSMQAWCVLRAMQRGLIYRYNPLK